LHYWAVNRLGLEPSSAAARLLGLGLSTGGAYAGAWAWRVRARRQGVSATAIEEVRRARRMESR
jgi:hypothetical protein